MPKARTFKDNVPPIKKSYRRATHYLTESLIKRLKYRAIEDGTDQSTIVRSALEAFLGPERRR